METARAAQRNGWPKARAIGREERKRIILARESKSNCWADAMREWWVCDLKTTFPRGASYDALKLGPIERALLFGNRARHPSNPSSLPSSFAAIVAIGSSPAMTTATALHVDRQPLLGELDKLTAGSHMVIGGSTNQIKWGPPKNCIAGTLIFCPKELCQLLSDFGVSANHFFHPHRRHVTQSSIRPLAALCLPFV